MFECECVRELKGRRPYSRKDGCRGRMKHPGGSVGVQPEERKVGMVGHEEAVSHCALGVGAA